MKINKIAVKNFRLLRDVSLQLDDRTTVIVGRNNSGKTSLTELFRRLLTDGTPTFQLEDFHLGIHADFWTAFTKYKEGKSEGEIRSVLPRIEAKIAVKYDLTEPDLGALADFIVDVSPDQTEAHADIRYQLADGNIGSLFDGINTHGNDANQRNEFFRAIKDRVGKYYRPSVRAVDPADPTNERPLEWTKLQHLLQSGFINAQRGLSDVTHRDNDVLGKILEGLFNTANTDTADAADRDTAGRLDTAIQSVQSDLDANFNEQLTKLLPAITLFGYPGLPDPKLRTETTLDVQRLLKDHTKIRYTGQNGLHMPEAYNGLGARNLIYILLKLHEFFKAFKASKVAPGLNLIFIEEPEAHLHPQMQEVFISQLNTIAEVFASTYNDGQPWPVQFVVTTHSSHMSNKAPFEATRYFLANADPATSDVCSTTIKDLGQGFSNTLEPDKDFLHQYMTLTSCDLLFADKAVLIEGTGERLLLPKMIEKVDSDKPVAQRLASQYVSVLEVGGAYAHIFFKLLDFLELRTLVITDLDSIDVNDARKRCKVSRGTGTSNACITGWFSDAETTNDDARTALTPADLIAKPYEAKVSGIRRLAYQIPDVAGQPCGRSFEDAFILANPALFGLDREGIDREEMAWDKANHVKKSEFALRHALKDTDWIVPRYIEEGLEWLALASECSTDTLPGASGMVITEAAHA